MILKSMVKKGMRIGVTIVLISSAIVTLPLKTQGKPKPDYFCAQLNGVWTTWARTSLGKSPIVRWKTTINKQWTPRNRCIVVSKRFSTLSDNGWLNNITSGEINQLPVLCGIRKIGDNCSSRNVILTLNNGVDPDYALEQMLNIQARAKGDLLELSGNKCFTNIAEYRQNIAPNNQAIQTCINKKIYYNMENAINAITEYEQKNGKVIQDESTLTAVTK